MASRFSNNRLAKRVAGMSTRRKAVLSGAIAVAVAAGITAATIGTSGAYLGDIKHAIAVGVNPTVHGTVNGSSDATVNSANFGDLAPGVPKTVSYKLDVTGSLAAHTYVVFDPKALNDGHGAGLNTFGRYAQFSVTLDGDTLFATTNANDNHTSCPPGSTSVKYPEPCKEIPMVIDLGVLKSGSHHTLGLTDGYPSYMTAQGAEPSGWNSFVDLDKNGAAFNNNGLPFNVDYQQKEAPAPTDYVPPTPVAP